MKKDKGILQFRRRRIISDSRGITATLVQPFFIDGSLFGALSSSETEKDDSVKSLSLLE